MGLLGFRTVSSEQGEVNTFNDQGVGGERVELTGDIERERERGETREGERRKERGREERERGSRYLVTHHSRTGNRI